jgi:hypothetical protein
MQKRNMKHAPGTRHTPEQKAAHQANNAKEKHEARTRHTPEQKAAHQANNAAEKREARTKHTPEQKAAIKANNAKEKHEACTRHTPEQKAAHQANNAAKKREARTERTAEQKAAIKANNAKEKRKARSKQTPEKHAADQNENRKNKKQKRAEAMSEKLSHQADFTLTSLEESTTFNDFEQNPETAVLLCLLNSGNEKFRQLDSVNMAADTMLPKEDLESLQKEIQDELLTPEEHQALLAEFFQAQGKGGFESVSHERAGRLSTKQIVTRCLFDYLWSLQHSQP